MWILHLDLPWCRISAKDSHLSYFLWADVTGHQTQPGSTRVPISCQDTSATLCDIRCFVSNSRPSPTPKEAKAKTTSRIHSRIPQAGDPGSGRGASMLWPMKTTEPSLCDESPLPSSSWTLMSLLCSCCPWPQASQPAFPHSIAMGGQQPWQRPEQKSWTPSMLVSSILQIKALTRKKIIWFSPRATMSSATPLTYLTGSSKPKRNWRRLVHCSDGFSSVTGARYSPCTWAYH